MRNDRRLRASRKDLTLVLLFLEMADAVRNGYSKIRCSPTRFSNEPRILRQGPVPLRLFQLETAWIGRLRRIPQYGEAGSFNCTVNYFTGGLSAAFSAIAVC